VTDSTTGIVANSTTGIVTDSTTGIVTNSTTGIGTVKLVSNREGKISSIGYDGVYRGVEVWFLSLTCAPLKGQWFTARPARSIQFQRQTGMFSCHRPVVYFLS
jgi:hypothetical protein